jgi:hypothetical protein
MKLSIIPDLPNKKYEKELDRLSSQVHSTCWRKDRKHRRDMITRISKEFQPGNPNMAYKEIRMVMEEFKALTNLCKGKGGTLLGDKEIIKTRWKGHFMQPLIQNRGKSRTGNDK